jgi:hypothetical protein
MLACVKPYEKACRHSRKVLGVLNFEGLECGTSGIGARKPIYMMVQQPGSWLLVWLNPLGKFWPWVREGL